MNKKILMVVLIILMIVIGIIINLNSQENIIYEVISSNNYLELEESKTRNYEIISKDNNYYLVINNGESSAYYSKLEVVKVETGKISVKVFVKLPEEEGQGEAFSYPKAIIKLNKKPQIVRIIYM